MPTNRPTMGNDVINGGRSNDTLSGGYGNDVLRGGSGSDQLNGGRGNDRLNGGAANDVVISRSDGGEGEIAQDISGASGVDAATRRIYANQAGLPADDVLTGGAGADEFRFQALINAKRDILLKHADANGVINYAGVAGENGKVHDHWVDGIGNDVITDFNKAQGDKIAISGHTTEVYNVEIADVDNDGQVDDTILHLRSNQGNAGAHHLDLLGTISVLNNELTADDFTVDANVTDGIVANVNQIEEAVAPINPRAMAAMGGSATGGGNADTAQVSTRTSMGNDLISGGRSSDTLSGDYGNDVLRGAQGRDQLDGGRGNDTVQGGKGRDVIVSRSDAGEVEIAQDISGASGVDAATRRIYANQAGLPADDVLTGGAGADEFRFQALINAKAEILRKHADANGVINYAGVAGENGNVHDHWVDGIGNDVITDFNKAQGDKIAISGHTTEVYNVEIADVDNDGQVDDTILHLRSNQGNAGAHHLDLLGTISVLNNELTADDFTVNANVTDGIVANISQINEAIAPGNPGAAMAAVGGAGAGAGSQGAGAGMHSGSGHGGSAASGAAAGDAQAANVGSVAYGGSGTAQGASGSGNVGSAGTGMADQTASGGADGTSGQSGGHACGATGTAGQVADTGTGTAAGNGTGDAVGGGQVADAGSGSATEQGTADSGGTGTQVASPGAAVTPVVEPTPTGPLAQLATNWGDNILDGNEGDDHMHGGHGDDVVSGQLGNDRLTGDYGDDILLGAAGDDRMSGDRGEDALFGGAGNDVLEGGSSNDLLMGAAGSDTIDGGTGLDTVLLSDGIGNYTIAVLEDQVRIAHKEGGDGIDVITQVEYYRFLADGDTYVVQNGAFTLTTDTEVVDELLSGHLLEELIAAEASGVEVTAATPTGGSAAGTATTAAGAAAAVSTASAIDANADHGTMHTLDLAA